MVPPLTCSRCGQEMVFDEEDQMWVCPDALMTEKVECAGGEE